MESFHGGHVEIFVGILVFFFENRVDSGGISKWHPFCLDYDHETNFFSQRSKPGEFAQSPGGTGAALRALVFRLP